MLVWLYVSGVSLILPDVRFGTVSLDWVTYSRQPIDSSVRVYSHPVGSSVRVKSLCIQFSQSL